MKIKVSLFLTALCCAVGTVSASEVDSVQVAEVRGNVAARKQRTDNDEYTRFRVGGYGEAVASFKDYGINRYYGNPNGNTRDHRNTISIPRFVLAMDYKFTPKWILSAEIEFEAGGTGSAMELENSENGEYETEMEKGGEVALEQFHITRLIHPAFNVRAGHMIVPVGLTNAHHEPLNYFTVYRPEGEATILPCTWHDTGISIWGRLGDFRYEVQMLAGLDAFMFDRENWIQGGAGSPFEFKVANKYGFAARIDNYTLPGLRVGLSGYYGQAMHNSYPHEFEGEDANGNKKTYDGTKGRVAIGAIDFTFNRYNWIVRGNADYGYLSNASTISKIKRNLTSNNAPYKKTPVGKNAVAVGIEAGYDVFSQIGKLREDNQKLYLFGRYEYYNSYIPAKDQAKYEYTGKNRMAFGVNYYPIPQIAVKAEYSKRFFKSQYNNEPSVSLGVAYQGFFL